MSFSQKDLSAVFSFGYRSLHHIITEGNEDKLLEYVKNIDYNGARRLSVLINIMKSFSNRSDIKLMALTGNRNNEVVKRNLPLMLYLFRYYFQDANLEELMDGLFENKESMDDQTYLRACDSLKYANKYKDIIFTDVPILYNHMS